MSTTLSFGYVKPQTGDKGSVFFPALEADIQQLNDHNHNGTNSSKLTSAAVTMIISVAQAASGGWGSIGGGRYSQTLTFPSGLSYDSCIVSARNNSDKSQIYPTIEKISSSQFTIYTNNNTLTYDLIYTS